MPRTLCHYAKNILLFPSLIIYKQKSLPVRRLFCISFSYLRKGVFIHEEHINNITYNFQDLLKKQKPYLMWMRYGIVLVTTLKKGSFQQLSHFVVVYASACKRKVKIQSHVCNRLYTKESFGLYHSAFSQQHDYIISV